MARNWVRVTVSSTSARERAETPTSTRDAVRTAVTSSSILPMAGAAPTSGSVGLLTLVPLRNDAQCNCCIILPVSYTHLRAHETDSYLVCRLLLEKKKKNNKQIQIEKN